LARHPLPYDTAEVEIGYQGAERVANLFPFQGWIDAGALVAVGSDHPVGRCGATHFVHGPHDPADRLGDGGADAAEARQMRRRQGGDQRRVLGDVRRQLASTWSRRGRHRRGSAGFRRALR
jgi:hypothetical protein